MTQIKRRHIRQAADYRLAMYWEEKSGQVQSLHPEARDVSEAGLRLASPVRVARGTQVYLDASQFGIPTEAVVRYCVVEGSGYRIGLEFTDVPQRPAECGSTGINYYEVLQLSPKAEPETIHRVFRIMAARFHPDNPQSGDQERFLMLTEAYRVLGDAEQRARYDAMRGTERQVPLPLFQAKAFVDDKEGEGNRRLGVLCLLYAQRRRDAEHPSIGLLELEEMMSIPREYLQFTLWYLKQKRYMECTEGGADFVLTAEGVDFVEENASAQSLFIRLLQRPNTGDPATATGNVCNA